MDRYFHFLYVRRGNAGVRTIRVPRSLGFAAIGLFAGLVAAATVLVAIHSGHVADNLVIRNLRSENARLTAELERFRSEADVLKDKMNVGFELQNRARLMASIEPLSGDVWQVGVGGLEPSRAETAYPDSIFISIDEDLDQMLRQSQLELQSYSEVLSVLEQEKEIRESTPSVRPLRGGFLSSRFGRRMDPFSGQTVLHPGLDYRARTGTPVISTADGVVARTGRNGGYGLMIEVEHGSGFKTRYAHLSKILVNRGQKVRRGEIIGLVGNTGRSTGSHLHYEVLFRKMHRDPLQYVIPDGICYE
jgi:murein DD-endopeptidase MepM/ murein hydrolase activator NlpD